MKRIYAQKALKHQFIRIYKFKKIPQNPECPDIKGREGKKTKGGEKMNGENKGGMGGKGRGEEEKRGRRR